MHIKWQCSFVKCSQIICYDGKCNQYIYITQNANAQCYPTTNAEIVCLDHTDKIDNESSSQIHSTLISPNNNSPYININVPLVNLEIAPNTALTPLAHKHSSTTISTKSANDDFPIEQYIDIVYSDTLAITNLSGNCSTTVTQYKKINL